MSTTTTYVSGSLATLLSTEMNALANNALALGAAYTTSPAGYIQCEVELLVTYGTAPTANTGVSLWFLRAIDGTAYEDGNDGTTTPARLPDVVFQLSPRTTAQRITKRVSIPPGLWKPLSKNDGTGQAMAGTGNTIRILPLTLQNG